MSDQKRTQMRLSLSELKLLVIDEISMVSNTALHHYHQRLKEIFGTSDSQLFAGLSVIALGDLYQLPPIQRKPVFEDYKNDALNLYHPWHVFKMIELTEITRQKDYQPFIEQLIDSELVHRLMRMFSVFNPGQQVYWMITTQRILYIYGLRIILLHSITMQN